VSTLHCCTRRVRCSCQDVVHRQRTKTNLTTKSYGRFGAVGTFAGTAHTEPAKRVRYGRTSDERKMELLDASRGVRSVLNFGEFCEGERVSYVDAKIAHSALDFCVAEEDLNGPQVARLLVDNGRLGSTQRVGPVFVSV
jgi:hypothetical protein